MGSNTSKATGAAPAANDATATAAPEKNAVSQVYVGVDLGGTNAKAGVVDGSGNLLKRADIPLADKTPEGTVKLLVDCINQALDGCTPKKTLADVAVIGIGSPGGIQDGCVTAAANFPGWENVPLAKMVSDATNGTKAILANDADSAVAAEVWVGAAKKAGVKNMVMLTLGTGVGAGVVIDGHIISGASGLIEGGHMIMDPEGPLCGCSQRGCLEMYASAGNVARIAKEEANKEGAESSLTGIESFGSKEVFDAAQAGDEVANRVIDQACDKLAVAIVNICRLLDTQLVVLAGGMTNAGDFLFDKIRAAYAKHAWTKLPNNAKIVGAEVGDDSGIIGAAAMGKKEHTGTL